MASESAIEVKVCLTEKDLEDFYSHLAKRSIGMKMVVVLSLIIFMAQSIRIIVNPSAIDSGVMWIAFVLFLFAMMLYSNKYNSRKMYNNNKRLRTEYTYLIRDQSIEIKSGTQSTTLKWKEITNISQSRHSLFLWLNKKHAQIIPKRLLTGDELEAITLLQRLNKKE